jgi:hypothetical protein
MQDPLLPKDASLQRPTSRTTVGFDIGRGIGKQIAHRRAGEVPDVPELHGLMGEETEAGKAIRIFCTKERSTKMLLSSAVPLKSKGTFIAKCAMAFLKEIECAQCSMTGNSDQEPVITAFIEDLGRIRAAASGGNFIIEHSPVGSRENNGVIDRGIQSVEQTVRVMCSALEEKWAVTLRQAGTQSLHG